MQAKKIADDFLCPRCGKETVVPVTRSHDDFLAVHKIVYGTTAESRVPCERVARQCTSMATREIAIRPAEKLECDFPKSHFKGGRPKPKAKGLFE